VIYYFDVLKAVATFCYEHPLHAILINQSKLDWTGQETEVASFCGQATTLLVQKLSGLQAALELVVALVVG
jgi:hypothetical protein